MKVYHYHNDLNNLRLVINSLLSATSSGVYHVNDNDVIQKSFTDEKHKIYTKCTKCKADLFNVTFMNTDENDHSDLIKCKKKRIEMKQKQALYDHISPGLCNFKR